MTNKKLNKIYVIIPLIIILIAIIGGIIIQTRDKEIYIGSIMPLSGDVAAYGIPLQKAVELAETEINRDGGINNKRLNMIFEDSMCSGKDALNATKKLIEIDNVKVIIGGICSSETLTAAPYTEEKKVILFSPGSTSPDVTNAGDYVFRNAPSDAFGGKIIAETAIKNNHKNIAIIYQNNDYGNALYNVFKNRYNQLGGNIIATEKYTLNEKDFTTYTTKLIAKNPDAIYIIPETGETLGLILKNLRTYNYNKTIYSNDMVTSEDVIKTYKKEAEGVIFTQPVYNENNPKTKEFITKMKSTYGEEIFSTAPSFYLALAYDATYLLKDAIDKCKEDTSCIKKELYAVKDWQGAYGKLTIDGKGDPIIDFSLKEIRNGEVIIIN